MASAEDLGKKLLAEAEEVGLDEILSLLRYQEDGSGRDVSGLPPLDQLLRNVREARSNAPRTTTTHPVVELMSLHPGSGQTHLLYHLCAQTVLPTTYSGKQSCVIILDTDGIFSVPKLATHIQSYLRRILDPSTAASTIDETIFTALKHIHIFRPQNLATTTATIAFLQDYLFDGDRHYSLDRQVGFIALDSASAFYWQDRADGEDAAFHASTTNASASKLPGPRPPSGYTALAAALKAAGKIFDCPIIFTSRHLGSTSVQHQHRAYRPSFPAAFSALPTLRLVLLRVPVRKFPANIALDAALREAPDRQRAVGEGKFVCYINEWGLDERAVQRLAASPGGGGFSFRIVGEDVLIGDA